MFEVRGIYDHKIQIEKITSTTNNYITLMITNGLVYAINFESACKNTFYFGKLDAE